MSTGQAAPAVCYVSCNEAYKEALSIGQNPAMCEKDSSFRQIHGECRSCIMDNTGSANATEGREYVNEIFDQFLEYCSLEAVTRTESFTLANGAVTVIEYPDEKTLGVTSTAEVPNSSTVTSSPGETSSEAASDPEPEQGGSKAWIAGAIVGPLLLIFLALLVYWLRRRGQWSASSPAAPPPSSPTMEKAQLHSDSISPYKFAQEADSGHVHELDASPRPGEFPANETPAHELPDKSHRRDG